VAGTYKFALVNTSGGCSDTVSVEVKNCCSITALPVIVNPCNNNLTTTLSNDDYFSVKITATQQYGGKYEVVQGAMNGVGGTVLNVGGTTSGTAVTTGKFKADGVTSYTLTIRDLQSPTCFIELPVIAPVASCSSPVCPPTIICMPLNAVRN
jgi:hypothetical protein